MKTSGTLLDWIKYKPSAFLKHPKLQEGVEVHGFQYHNNGIECTYMSSYGDGPPMTPYFGNQCPYVTKGKVNFTACVTHSRYGCGSMQAIADSLANDDRWEEVNGQ